MLRGLRSGSRQDPTPRTFVLYATLVAGVGVALVALVPLTAANKVAVMSVAGEPRTRTIAVGSLGGVAAAERGECDLAPVHLIDPETGVYNAHLLRPGLSLVKGWQRLQGVVYRAGDARFEDCSAQDAVKAALAPLGDVRFVVMATLLDWLLCPALAWLITRLLPIAQPYAIGLLLIGLAPGCAPPTTTSPLN